MQDPKTCLQTHTLRPLTAADFRDNVPEEYLALGAFVCPECGLIYSRAFAERHPETLRAA